MKRSELSALTDLLAAGTITDSESQRLADFLRQIAEAKPAAAAYVAAHDQKPRVTGWDAKAFTAGEEVALYTLPLED